MKNNTIFEEKFVEYQNNKLCYNIGGTGMPLMLLHGFLENKTIWNTFSTELTEYFKIIAVDLPGHGKSELSSSIAGPEFMAEAMLSILKAENIEKVFMVGHSMGGYASCAFADMYPEKLSALCLFHSVPFADSQDGKKNRDKAIKRVDTGKTFELCSLHAPRVFASKNLSAFARNIQVNTQIALSTNPNTIKATLRGMRDRKDYSDTIKQFKQPLLYVQGKYDNFIPQGKLKVEDLPAKHEFLLLENSGHIGFIEEKEKAIQAVKVFGEKVYSGNF